MDVSVSLDVIHEWYLWMKMMDMDKAIDESRKGSSKNYIDHWPAFDIFQLSTYLMLTYIDIWTITYWLLHSTQDLERRCYRGEGFQTLPNFLLYNSVKSSISMYQQD